MKVENIKGMYCPKSIFVEGINNKTNKVIIRGLMLPKNQISRNKVMYEWESIKDKHKSLINKPTMYNHQIDSDMPPAGHFTDSMCLTSEPHADSKWYKAWIETAKENNDVGVPGWYYEADLNPDNEYTKSVLRGDLQHVSIQLFADQAYEKEDFDHGNYTLAHVGNILEGSLVPVPGFEQTSIEVALAEAFRNGKINSDERAALLKAEPGLEKEIEEKVGKKTYKEVDVADGNHTHPNLYNEILKNRSMIQKLNGEPLEEEMNTTTAGGAIAPAKLLKKKTQKELNNILEFIDGLSDEEAKIMLNIQNKK